MEFVVKKTNDLSDSEKQAMLDLFNIVFEQNRKMDVFLNQYIQNPCGYSYHSLMIDANKIVGFNSYVPSYCMVDGKRVFVANSCDTLVFKPYRDFFNLADMIAVARKAMTADGVAFYYGFPNDNSYPVVIKGKITKEVGVLDTYFLPYRVGGIVKKLKILNPFSKLFSYLLIYLGGPGKKTVANFRIAKELVTFNQTRYKRMDGEYSIVPDIAGGFTYKVMEHEGVHTAFLIDVFEKSERNFKKAVKYIVRKEKQNFDILLYVGYLPKGLRNIGLVRIPHKYEPKHFHFTARVLNKDEVDEKVLLNIENWDVNLSNYDII